MDFKTWFITYYSLPERKKAGKILPDYLDECGYVAIVATRDRASKVHTNLVSQPRSRIFSSLRGQGWERESAHRHHTLRSGPWLFLKVLDVRIEFSASLGVLQSLATALTRAAPHHVGRMGQRRTDTDKDQPPL